MIESTDGGDAYSVMACEGRPSTTLLDAGSKVVDGGPEPVLGRAKGPTRGLATTCGQRQASRWSTCSAPGSYAGRDTYARPIYFPALAGAAGPPPGIGGASGEMLFR